MIEEPQTIAKVRRPESVPIGHPWQLRATKGLAGMAERETLQESASGAESPSLARAAD